MFIWIALVIFPTFSLFHRWSEAQSNLQDAATNHIIKTTTNTPSTTKKIAYDVFECRQSLLAMFSILSEFSHHFVLLRFVINPSVLLLKQDREQEREREMWKERKKQRRTRKTQDEKSAGAPLRVPSRVFIWLEAIQIDCEICEFSARSQHDRLVHLHLAQTVCRFQWIPRKIPLLSFQFRFCHINKIMRIFFVFVWVSRV